MLAGAEAGKARAERAHRRPGKKARRPRESSGRPFGALKGAPRPTRAKPEAPPPTAEILSARSG
jgi:hypothetical protein